MQSKIAKKVLSGILSGSLMFQMGMPVVYAEVSNLIQERKTITAFADLAGDVKKITVPIGTLKEELPLPERITAAVERTVYDNVTVDSNAVKNGSESSATGKASGDIEQTQTTTGGNISLPSGTFSIDSSKAEGTQPKIQLVGKKVNDNVDIAVTWESDKPFSSEKADTFIYTAKLTDESYTLGEGVKIPKITVTVVDENAVASVTIGNMTSKSQNEKTINHLKITSADGSFETNTNNGGLIKITSGGSYILSMDGAASSTTGILIEAPNGTVNLILDGITVETANECLKSRDTNYSDKDKLQVIVDLNGKASYLTYTGSDLQKYFGTSPVMNMEVTDSKSGGSLAINGGLFADGRVAPYGNIQFKKGTITIDPKRNTIGSGKAGDSAYISIDGADVIIPKEVDSQGGKVFLCWNVPITAGSFTWEGAEVGNLDTTRGVMTLGLNGGTATVGKLSSMYHQINGGVLNGDVVDSRIKIKGGRINGSVTDYTKIQLPYQKGEKISIENTFWAYNGKLTTQDWNAADSEKTEGKITLWIRNGYDQKITIGSTVYEYKWDLVTSSFRSKAGATVRIVSDLSYNASLPQGYTNLPQFSITAEKTELAQSADTITYQWYENNEKIPLATEPSYTMPIGKLAGEYTYYCDVTCGGYSIYTGMATVKVVDAVAGVEINGNNSYYDNLNSAFAAVLKDGKSTITLLKDIDLGTSSVPDHNMKGDITLNLNGKTLSSSGNDGVITPHGYQRYPLTITGTGTISYSGSNNLGGAISYFSSAPHNKLTIEDNVQIVTSSSRVVYLGGSLGGADLQIKGNAKLITSSGSTVIYAQDPGSNIIIDGGTLQNNNVKKIIVNKDGNVVINKNGVIMTDGSVEASSIYFNVANDGVPTTGNTWYRINTDEIQSAVNSNKMEFTIRDNTTTNDNLLYGKKNETVSFTATAKAGYVISDIAAVTKGSTALSVTKTQGDYTSAQNTCTFSFTMPSDDGVAVSIPVKLEDCLKLVGESISRAYDGTAFELSTTKGAHFTWSSTGTATIDGYYTDNTGSTQTTESNSGAPTNGGAPKNVGTYYAKVSVSADDVYAATIVYVPFTIIQSGTTFDGGLKTYKDNTATNIFNYGDTITVKVTPKATGIAPATNGLRMAPSFSAPIANQMALFVGETQITEPVNAAEGIYTMTYDTKAKDLVIGNNTITAKYVDNSNMADYSENVTVKLNKKAITSALVNTSDSSASKEYDGANGFEGVALTLNSNDILSFDMVTATAKGTVADANAGTDKALTTTSVTLNGDNKDYYSLDNSTVSGNVSITQAANTGVNQELHAVRGLAKEYAFDLTKLLPTLFQGKSFGDITYTVENVTNNDNVLSHAPTNNDIKDGKITLKVANVADKDKIAAIQIKVASKNYKDFTANLNVKTIDKTSLTIEAVFTSETYNGKPYAYTGTPTFKNGAKTVSGITYTAKYAGKYGTIYDESETAPTNAGKYNLILTVSGKSANTYAGTTTIGFEITQKQITAKPNDVSMESNTSFPAYTWSIDTGITGENITAANAKDVVIQAQENGTKLTAVKVGTFDIVFTTVPIFNQNGDTEKNYDIQIGKGKLIITKHNSDGSSSSGGVSSSTVTHRVDYVNDKGIIKTPTDVKVDLTKDSTKISAVNMDSLINENKDKTVVMNGKNYSITFQKGTMKHVDGKTDFDFGVNFNIGENYSKINELSKGNLALMVSYNYSGELPAEASIRINVGRQYASQILEYYYYNKAKGTLEFMQSVVADDKGFVIVKQTHCYDYALIPAGASITKDDVLPRIGGSDRYETAALISKAGWTIADTVVLAGGDNYADALAGTPLAYKLNAPMLLTDTGKLNEKTSAEIKRLGAKKVVILGGTGAISKEVEKSLEDMGLTLERINGDDRFETAALIAKRVSPQGVETAVVVYGMNFPDALSVSSYAAANGMPILLTDNHTISKKTLDTITELKVKKTIVVGGSSVLGEDVISKLPDAKRLWGNDRYDTCMKVVSYFKLDTKQMYVATGLQFADAISGAVLSAKRNTGILLVDGKETQENILPYGLSELIKDNGITGLTILGGSGSVNYSTSIKLKELMK